MELSPEVQVELIQTVVKRITPTSAYTHKESIEEWAKQFDITYKSLAKTVKEA